MSSPPWGPRRATASSTLSTANMTLRRPSALGGATRLLRWDRTALRAPGVGGPREAAAVVAAARTVPGLRAVAVGTPEQRRRPRREEEGDPEGDVDGIARAPVLQFRGPKEGRVD